MALCETIGMREFYNQFADEVKARCIEEEDDLVIIYGGSEGAGKSTLAMSLGGVDCNFYKNYYDNHEQVYFLWDHFLQANDMATTYAAQEKTKFFRELAGDAEENRIVKKLLEKYRLNENDFKIDDPSKILPPGAYRQYDESGTQMFNRDAQKKSVKDQVKMFIANRSNRGVYALNLPKVHYADKYIREERIKKLIIIRKTYPDGDLRKPERIAYIWGKDRINELRNKFGGSWTYVLETNFGMVFKQAPPNFRIDVPQLVGKYIPKEVYALYQVEKTYFQKSLSKEMKGEYNGISIPKAKIAGLIEKIISSGKSQRTAYNMVKTFKEVSKFL